jgi:hypothetical protein
MLEASKYTIPFNLVRKHVLPDRQAAAEKEEKRNRQVLKKDGKAKVNVHHANFLKQWWLLSWARAEMITAIKVLGRYVACGRVTKRPIFEFVTPAIHPNDACMVFPFEDDYSFGILQSAVHWKWFVSKCSTLKSDFRYTSDTVFDTFPWPQSPTPAQIVRVASASRSLRDTRRKSMCDANLSLRQLYRLVELPGDNPVKAAQDELDSAVRHAYGMSAESESLDFLLVLNLEVAAMENRAEKVEGPGIPSGVKDVTHLISKDRLEMGTSLALDLQRL